MSFYEMLLLSRLDHNGPFTYTMGSHFQSIGAGAWPGFFDRILTIRAVCLPHPEIFKSKERRKTLQTLIRLR